ncbi:hypothetical protein [Thauera humireducens]|uniref:hypothetical protein n=1 Tax=Thauera humireducens TaxID=1134435 RepID=UPI00311D48E7
MFSTQLLVGGTPPAEFACCARSGWNAGNCCADCSPKGQRSGWWGGVLGVALGHGLAVWRHSSWWGAILAQDSSAGPGPQLQFDGLLIAGYLLLGVAAGVAGTWLPAREASRVRQRALKAGRQRTRLSQARGRPAVGLGLLALAATACLLPPLAGIPVGGYAAVACLLAAAVLLLPWLARALLPLLGRAQGVGWRLAHARLSATPGQAVVAGAGCHRQRGAGLGDGDHGQQLSCLGR